MLNRFHTHSKPGRQNQTRLRSCSKTDCCLELADWLAILHAVWLVAGGDSRVGEAERLQDDDVEVLGRDAVLELIQP